MHKPKLPEHYTGDGCSDRLAQVFPALLLTLVFILIAEGYNYIIHPILAFAVAFLVIDLIMIQTRR